MRKILGLLLLLFFVVAYFTKPDNKTCIIEGVRAVWGNITPNPYDKPDMFETFMNLQSPNVKVNDWIFFKQVKYKIASDEKTVAYAAFKKVFATVKPVKFKHTAPKMSKTNSK